MHTSSLVERNAVEGAEPLCAWLEGVVNYLFLINSSAISSLVCCFHADSVLDLRRALWAAGY